MKTSPTLWWLQYTLCEPLKTFVPSFSFCSEIAQVGQNFSPSDRIRNLRVIWCNVHSLVLVGNFNSFGCKAYLYSEPVSSSDAEAQGSLLPWDSGALWGSSTTTFTAMQLPHRTWTRLTAASLLQSQRVRLPVFAYECLCPSKANLVAFHWR